MNISVIVPSYKPQNYLWECLESLYCQTLSKKEFEVLIVLNGCDEPYHSQIDCWVRAHPDLQVNVIQTDEAGVSNARNLALDLASGMNVTFIDDDDYVSENYLKAMLDKIDDETIVLTNPYAFNDGDKLQLSYRITDEYNRLASKGRLKASKGRKFFSGPCMKLIPMSFIQGRRFDKRFRVGEDSLFMYSISDKFKYVICSDDSAIYYRRYRETGAIKKKKSSLEILWNNLKLQKTILYLYFSHFGKYGVVNTLIFLTSVLKGGLYQAFVLNRK